MSPQPEYLRPCPFCGSQKVNVDRTNEVACRVACARSTCGAQAPSRPARAAAIRQWNKRASFSGIERAVIVNDDDKHGPNAASTYP